MTRQESFKRSVRDRMAKTGEKYGAARRALLPDDAPKLRTNEPQTNEPQTNDALRWVEQPETSDEAVRDGTGRSWDEWCQLIDGWPERSQGHAAMAARIGREHLDNGWWAQTVIVGYERIRGLRIKYGRADGSFAGSATRTLAATKIDGPDTGRAGRLRAALLDPERQAEIVSGAFRRPPRPVKAGLVVEQRSKPNSKAVRWAINPDQGSAQFSVEARPDGKVRVSIQHQQLLSTEAVESWKEFWSDWLASLDESG